MCANLAFFAACARTSEKNFYLQSAQLTLITLSLLAPNLFEKISLLLNLARSRSLDRHRAFAGKNADFFVAAPILLAQNTSQPPRFSLGMRTPCACLRSIRASFFGIPTI